MRELVTIRKIDEIIPIEGADSITIVKLDGWECVALKSEFSVGDLCVYFEIDSLIPLCPQVEHIRARAYKKFNDIEGVRIKTIRLRGQISQGLALPVNRFPQVVNVLNQLGTELSNDEIIIAASNTDWTELLQVQKYEPPMPSELEGVARGNFPGFIPKTEQQRCQNIGRKIFVDNKDSKYEISMKLDGTSFTAYSLDGHTGVCSRVWELDINEDTKDNKLVRMFIDSKLRAFLAEFGGNLAIQGELLGPGIQQNREMLKSHVLYVFDMYDIDKKAYLSPEQRHDMMIRLHNSGVNISHVPILYTGVTLSDVGVIDTSGLLKFAEGPSIHHAIREGMVCKRMDGKFSFKVISNQYLLKEKD